MMKCQRLIYFFLFFFFFFFFFFFAVELTSLLEAKGRVLTLRIPNRDSVSGELSLIVIPPSTLVSMVFGGHESQQACTGFFVVDDAKGKPVNKFTVVLVREGAPGQDPEVQVELKVTINCSFAADPQPIANSTNNSSTTNNNTTTTTAIANNNAAAPADNATRRNSDINTVTRRHVPQLSGALSSQGGQRYRCKEFVAADYAAAAELALKFCNTVLDEHCNVLSITERPFGTTGAACVKVWFEVLPIPNSQE
jgi:hypothetical protein